LRWLARFAGAPQVFDAMLFAATGLFHPTRLCAMSAIEATVRQWPGVKLGVHRFGGMAFVFDGKESSHLHGNGLLDCFVGPANRDALVAAGRASPHHIFPASGWISFWINDGKDVEPALELIRKAAEAK
jgi:hypothetical protein